jgi:hypothetical protein
MAKIEKPIIILGSPRSGTTFLFTLLNQSKELYSLYEESRFLFRDFYQKYKNKFDNDALLASDLDEEDKENLINNFHRYSFKTKFIGKLVNKGIKKKLKLLDLAKYFANLNFKAKENKTYRIVEKTPRNAFKVELLKELFPDALFVYIKRDGRSNISSLIEAWKKRELTDLKQSKRLPQITQELNFSNYKGKAWRFTLPPNWQNFINSSLEEVCAFQWKSANDAIQESLKNIDQKQVLEIHYEDLVKETEKTVENLCNFAQIEFNNELKKICVESPAVNYFDGKPSFDKWKKNEEQINKILPYIEDTQKAMSYA